MSKRVTFILLQNKWFRWTVKLFLKTSNNKVDQRNIKFTTEHKVSEKERSRNARLTPAEFSTSDPIIIDGLLRDTGYGKTFVMKDDLAGEKKRESFKTTPLDVKKIALRNLFKASGLDFDEDKDYEVLAEEYNFYIAATNGVVIGKSSATEIAHIPVNVHQELLDTVASARKVYEDKYGEAIPAEYANDMGFLSALSDPNWDAKAYIAEQSVNEEEVKEDDQDQDVETAESVQKLYFETFGVNVAPPKKNDLGWMKKKIEEKLAK